jgi:hypothetical protein
MLTFLGYELELAILGAITQGDGRNVHYGADVNGDPWLVVGVEESPERLVWVCAAVTVRMLEEVVAGRADAWDAIRHSITGMVDIVTIENGQAVPDRCVRSAALNPTYLTHLDGGLTLAA